MRSTLATPVAVEYSPTFPERVSNVIDQKIWCNGLADETGASCMTVILEPFKPPSFTHVHCRCEKTGFFPVFAFVWSTLLAQVVLTLRIYAITGKNRTITACLGVITISQFVLGLYLIAYMATEGCESLTKRCLQFVLQCFSSTDPADPTRRL
ncbi:hypothetical protein BDM02DRAFT_1059840 [Thelephora ganbajun]|uniref:Uncharacterized protein n=1 Tax=Thelephora ganbajun TaxID=370292 RepID=A0ACB6Z3P9_THEGA|nr:hypothetical protein BDM02DRAFT_1059840 [Thelephora ganbajun]